jgi:TIR domain
MFFDQPLFISYSRKDYYFAESLVYHLGKRDIPAWLDAKDLKPGVDWARDLEGALDRCPCFILVLSPDSVRSENVRHEWQRAQTQRKRIIVAQFRRAELPTELQDAEIVDFRGAFMPAIELLATRLTKDLTPAGRDKQTYPMKFAFPLPPWVAGLSAMLAVLCLFPLLLADYGDIFASVQGSVEFRVAVIALLLVVIGLFLWHCMAAFLLRRMSMTRLAACFAFFVYATGYPLLQHFAGSAVPQLFPEATMGFIRNGWPLAVLLFVVALGGLGIAILKRPEDLLRWTPTGKAWGRCRIKYATRGRDNAVDIASRLKQTNRFYLVHDANDMAAATRLKQELLRAGATEAVADAAGASAVLLLTNRTRTDWLDSQAQRLRGTVLTVVGTGIRLPDSLDWLWKRQWIDFRLWRAQVADHEAGLPQVPEALTLLRLPAPVNCAHHLICATSALLFIVGTAVIPQTTSQTEVLTLQEALGMLSFVGAMMWAVLARGLLRRRFSETKFFCYAAIGFIATIGLGFWGLYDLAMTKQGFIRVLLPLLFLVASPMWLRYLRKDLGFWFPHPGSEGNKKSKSLAPGRNWRTLLWLTIYALGWTAVLDPEH